MSPRGPRAGGAQGHIRVEFGSASQADAARAALEPDNGGHLRARIEGNALVLEAEATTPLGLLRTFDDALACLRATGLP